MASEYLRRLRMVAKSLNVGIGSMLSLRLGVYWLRRLEGLKL